MLFNQMFLLSQFSHSYARFITLPANVGIVMAKRIEANKRLAQDPNDCEARRMLQESEDQVS
ncbi:unnamed protein product [Gongylonema pulchrum]|uniref:Uncharacterized protein n=1 Tax=Gongylonema pulchrum TaxID=637853 RepID=A0A183EZJ4_9BILA|nr:unnamed protein product [Gongylonema pulchrum]